MRNSALLVSLALATVLLLSIACNPYKRMAKSRQLADRDSAAFYFYEHHAYHSSSILFEELLNAYRSTPRAEIVTYYYAKSKMYEKEYITAGHYFQQLVDQFPSSDYAEESQYNIAYCLYLQTNHFELDQSETVKAIEAFQFFASLYPTSPNSQLVNNYIHELRDRLARKAFFNADLYLLLSHFKAATVAYKGMLNEYPDSEYREDAQFRLYKAQVEYARKSIPARQEARYLEASALYTKFTERFPESRHLNEAKNLYGEVEHYLNHLKKPVP